MSHPQTQQDSPSMNPKPSKIQRVLGATFLLLGAIQLAVGSYLAYLFSHPAPHAREGGFGLATVALAIVILLPLGLLFVVVGLLLRKKRKKTQPKPSSNYG